MATFQATFLQLLPKPPLAPDQVKLLRVDNVVSTEAEREGRSLPALGIEPTTIEAIVTNYLWRFRKTGQFGKRRADDRGQRTGNAESHLAVICPPSSLVCHPTIPNASQPTGPNTQ